jgi:acyl-CoA synthetase (AMP-forming)/AMP-acid ligase II
MGRSISELWEGLAARAARFARRAAFLGPGRPLTFADLHARGALLARELARAGIGRGDVVGLALPNGPDLPAAFLALAQLPAAAALLSPAYGRDAFAAIARELRPRCVLMPDAKARDLVEAMDAARAEPLVDGTLAAVFPEQGASPAAGRALVKLTSGSTGPMKGVGLDAGNVVAEAENLVASLALAPADRILAPVPLFHSYGFDLGILASLWSGAALVTTEAFIPRRLLVDLGQSTIFLGVPAMYRLLLDARCDPPALDRVRYLLSCTAPLGPHTIEAFHARFGVPICQHYGSSETGGATLHDPAHVLARPDSVGRALPGVAIDVVDGAGRPLPPGRPGEVVVRGAAVSRGYVTGAPERACLRDGAYFTGDLGRLDDAGFLTVEGRLDRLINVGGLKVSPDEVAQALERHPAVREAAVMGVEAGGGEQGVYAAVTLKGAADETALLAFLRGRLADYKVPRRIDILPELPRTASGKVRLRENRP